MTDLQQMALEQLHKFGPYAAISYVAHRLQERGILNDSTLTPFVYKALDFVDAFPKIRSTMALNWIKQNT